MATTEDANLILKLYELRREPKMREARDWFFMHFNPETMEDYKAALMSEHSAHLRMVTSYWDMATALANHGAIDAALFAETQGEHVGVFAKIQHLLPEIRQMFSDKAFYNLEKFALSQPGGQANIDQFRERVKGMRAMIAQHMAAKAQAGEN